MKAFATLVGLSLASLLTAQSTISTVTAPPGGNSQGIPGTMFFDMTVSPATGSLSITKLEVNHSSPAGTAGKIRLWQTIPGFGFSGSETNRERWVLLAEGNILSSLPAPVPPATISVGLDSVCFETPIVLTNAMGTRGYAVEYLGLVTRYTTGNGSNQNVSNADLTIALGATQQNLSYFDADTTEVGGVAFHVGVLSPRVFNGVIHYSTGAPLACSYTHKRGTGCGDEISSWFQKIYSNAGASSVLTGNGAAKRTVTMFPDGLGGYLVINTTGGTLISTAGHNTVALASGTVMAATPPLTPQNDGENLVPPTPMAWSFPASGGPVSQLFVNTNGVVTTSSLQAFLTGTAGIDWAPRLSDLLNGPEGWYSWHDYDFTTAGALRWFDTGSQLIVTWENVPSAFVPVTQISTFQMTFDVSGTVTMFWDSIDPTLLPYYSGIPHLVGYSRAGNSIRPLETDLSNPTPGVWGQFPISGGATEINRLAVTSSPRPVNGSTITYTIDNLPAAGFAELVLSIGNPNFPGVPLALIDPSFSVANCLINFDIFAFGEGPVVAGPGPVAYPFSMDTIAVGLLGIDWWMQPVGIKFFTLPVQPVFMTGNALHQRVELN